MNLPDEVKLCDFTLREGSVQAGVKFTPEEQRELVTLLDSMGVPFIGLYFSDSIGDTYESARRLGGLGLKAKLVGMVSPFYEWRMRSAADWKQIVDPQIDAGIQIIEMLYYLTDWRLQGTVYEKRMTSDEVIDTMGGYIDYVRSRGAIPFPVVTDTARVDLDILKKAYRSNVAAGAGIVGVNDSFGAMIPATMRYLVREIKNVVGTVPVKIHCHNDTGLGLANTLAGVEGGAEIVDGNLNGYGDRGFTDLTALAVNLTINYGFDLGVDLGRMYEASKAAERMTQMAIAPSSPLIGDYAFSTSAELHNHGMDDAYWSASVLDPTLYGKKPKVFVTAKSGPSTVRRKLEELGISVNDEVLSRATERIREADASTKGILSDADIRRLVAELV